MEQKFTKNNLSWWKNPFEKYFQKVYQKKYTFDENNIQELLDENEVLAIKKLSRKTLFLSACLGASGVIFLYVPTYIFPSFFPLYKLNILGFPLEFPLIFTIYGLVLAVLEIVLLVLLNVNTVAKMGKICHFPHPKDELFEIKTKILYEVGIEKPAKELLFLGIDPMEGLSKFQITIITLWNMLKATLSNLVVKFLLSRILGRFALRYTFISYFIDLISIPIFAFWDFYTSKRVIKEAKVRIMAPETIKMFVKNAHNNFKEDEDFKAILFDCLRFIAIAKRSFHHSHYLLAQEVVNVFQLETDNHQKLTRKQLLDKIKLLSFQARFTLARLFILGMLIDGELSKRDWKVLEELDKQDHLLSISYSEIKEWEQDFLTGRGLKKLLQAEFQQT
jgi:hypothetical protein